MEAGHVYILTNDGENVIYVGVTNNLRKRINHHKKRLVAGFTKKYNVHRLIYYENYRDINIARFRERELKGYTRAKKDALIRKINPHWNDLFEML